MKYLTKSSFTILNYIKAQIKEDDVIVLSNKHLRRELGYTIKTIVIALQSLEKENIINLYYENPRLRKISLTNNI